MTTYRIRNWSQHFENNRTRELKELRFVILPNKHDGDGYTELLDHPNGAAHYGAWCALVQVASKGQHPADTCDNPAGCCECRGMLLREGARPHDPASLSRLTRIPAEVFEEVLPRLVNIGWLESSEPQVQQIQADRIIPHPPAVARPSQSRTPLPKSAPELNRTEEKRIEEKKEETPSGVVSQTTEDFTIWKLGVGKLMSSCGLSEQSAKGFIAKQAKDYGKPAVAAAITQMLAQEAIEPRSYIIQVLKNGANNGTSKPRYEPASARSARNLRENGEYIRGLSNSDSETDREDPIGLLASGV